MVSVKAVLGKSAYKASEKVDYLYNLFTLSIIYPTIAQVNHNQFGVIIPNMIQYIDNLIGVFYIHTEVFSQYDMEIYLGCSIILFVITYILAINKARKNTITI